MNQPDSGGHDVLRLTHERTGTVHIVHAAGEIDAATAPALLRAALMEEAGTATPLVLDLGDVTFLDSAGLTALLQIDRQLHATDNAFTIVAHHRAVLRALEITRLDQVLTIVSSLDEALR